MRGLEALEIGLHSESWAQRDTKICNVLDDVRRERHRQQTKFQADCEEFHEPRDRGISVLAEEVGEVAKALLEGDHRNYYEECIQVAAVAAAMAEAAKRAGWAD